MMHRGLLVQVHRQLQDCFNKKEENYKEGVMHGQVKKYYPDGRVFETVWEDGECKAIDLKEGKPFDPYPQHVGWQHISEDTSEQEQKNEWEDISG